MIGVAIPVVAGFLGSLGARRGDVGAARILGSLR